MPPTLGARNVCAWSMSMSGTRTWGIPPVSYEQPPGQGLRVVVSGASHWHLPRHADNLRRAGVTFAGVADPDPAVADRWARNLGCRALPDPAALAALKPDLALALGRVSDMATQARTFLEAGIALLCEKPIGLHAGEVRAVADLARRTGVWASVALVRRYDALWNVLDDLAGAQRLGNIAHLHLRIVNGPPQRYAAWGSGWMLDPLTAGGGALLNLGIHGLDFFQHLVREPVSVAGAAVTHRAHGQPIEDFGAVILRSAGGVVGTVEAGYTYPDVSAGMTRNGDNETRIGAAQAYLTVADSGASLTTAGGVEPLPSQPGDRYQDWIFDSLARYRAGHPPAASIEDCLAAVELVGQAYALAGGR
jgi:predicted dehydrogenase